MPNPKLTRAEIIEDAEKGSAAQLTFLDRLAYAVEYQTYNNMASLAFKGKKEVEITDDDDNPITDPDILKQRRYEERESLFQEDEMERLDISVDDETISTVDAVYADLALGLRREVEGLTTLEENKIIYQQIGMINALNDLEKGKNYEKMLETVPENDPNREDKAFYLAMITQNTAFMRDKATHDVVNNLMSKLVSNKNKMYMNSPFKDVEYLKSLTLAKYLDDIMLAPEEQQNYFKNLEERGIEATPQSNMYDIFKSKMLSDENIKKQQMEKQGRTYEIKEPTDDEIKGYAFDEFHQRTIEAYMRQGHELALSGMSPEDRKTALKGNELKNIVTYDPPKAIREWSKNEAIDLAIKPRVDELNNNYEKQRLLVSGDKPLRYDRNSALKGCFPLTTKKSTAYEKYINKHSGFNAIGGSLKEQKTHLAKVIAANALEANGRSFSVSDVHSMAKRIENMQAFKEMGELEVSRGLHNRYKATDTQLTLAKKTFGLDASKYQSYINKMKKLSANIVPHGRQSKEYIKFKQSVDAIAKLDPSDPEIEMQMMSANENLINSITDYSKGKKKVRTYDEGRARFNNCMDALAVASDSVPGLKQYADELVNRTNFVRKVHEGDPDYIDLKNFGAANAENALKERQNAKKGPSAAAENNPLIK